MPRSKESSRLATKNRLTQQDLGNDSDSESDGEPSFVELDHKGQLVLRLHEFTSTTQGKIECTDAVWAAMSFAEQRVVNAKLMNETTAIAKAFQSCMPAIVNVVSFHLELSLFHTPCIWAVIKSPASNSLGDILRNVIAGVNKLSDAKFELVAKRRLK
jgi:hypothetical protein